MMKSLPINPLDEDSPKNGFALIIALTLMSLTILLIVTLTSFVRVQTQSAQSQLESVEARQNAILGLKVALGEVQTLAGPDQRSVARADVMSQHQRVGLSRGSIVNTPTDTRRLWVGVSHSDGQSDLYPLDLTYDTPVAWLVSGLNRALQPADQLSDPGAIQDPVEMVTVQENTAPTSDRAITLRAGQRPIGSGSDVEGTFAWIVDDETSKAKLVPSNQSVDNESPAERLENQRVNLPGFFDPTETTGLNLAKEDYYRAFEIQDLGLAGANTANEEILNDRYFDYTLDGYGVLADTREGGLKKDLTAAYENDAVFQDLFPSTSTPPYITMDPDKFASSPDLQANGYIHHGIFRDYYGLKDEIQNNELPISLLDKRLVIAGSDLETRSGNVGPHEINNLNHPYGQFQIGKNDGSGLDVTADGAHNPITPVLAFIQQNAWAEIDNIDYDSGAERYYAEYEQNAQLWMGVYNPYNVNLRMAGFLDRAGPTLFGYPMPYLNFLPPAGGTLPLSQDNRFNVGNPPANNLMQNERWIGTIARIDPVTVVAPGETQMFGFSNDVDVGSARNLASTFSDDVVSASTYSSYRNKRMYFPDKDDGSGGTPTQTPEVDMLVEFAFTAGDAFSGGGNARGYGLNTGWGLPSKFYNRGARPNSSNETGHEVAQIFYFPFSEDFMENGGRKRQLDRNLGSGSPGVEFLREGLTFGENTGRMSNAEEAAYRFSLRTTTETEDPESPRLRPLIDGNIRAIWNNPKWDSGLGLKSLATHTLQTNKSGDPIQFVSPIQEDNGRALLSNGNGNVFQTILFDIPREPLVSIGQLQHAAAGRFSYEPSYIVGNSYANIRLPLDNWFEASAQDDFSSRNDGLAGIGGDFRLYDSAYLVNEALFDSYTFTTIPQDSSQAELDDYFSQTELLQNPRYIPYEPEDLNFDTDTLLSDESGSHNAGFVMVDGAFNVNSTSVEAWEVFLSGTKGLPYRRVDENGNVTFEDVDSVRFPRVQSVLGEAWEGSPNQNYWTGFRGLLPSEIRELAEAIVEEIQERGPFHNLSDFVNRDLSNDDNAKSGALQAALDATVNAGLPASFEAPATSTFPEIPTNNTQGVGFPGQLLQGDILQSLAPYMQTRSDTFKIRSYGSIGDVDNDETSVWCEAVVQRVPDFVRRTGISNALDELASPSSPFGRKFKVVSFRWLEKSEI